MNIKLPITKYMLRKVVVRVWTIFMFGGSATSAFSQGGTQAVPGMPPDTGSSTGVSSFSKMSSFSPLIALPPSSTAPNTYPWPSTGPIGIGTTTPTSQLSVVGNIDIPSAKLFGYALSNNFTYESQTMGHYAMSWIVDSTYSGGAFFWLSGYGGLKFFTGGLPRLMVGEDGSTGIGTVAPRHPLHVVGSNAAVVPFYTWGANYGAAIGVQNSTTNYYAFSVFGNINPDGTDGAGGRKNYFYVRGDGNVGIGTASPQSLLSVEGTITAKGVTVTQNGWSDFVFDSAYRPMPLSVLSRFTAIHKHLPDIPSASEIERSGLDLGKMQKLQMQKIEELTIYLAEADKRASQDEAVIQQQQAKLEQQQSSILSLEAQLKALREEIEGIKTHR